MDKRRSVRPEEADPEHGREPDPGPRRGHAFYAEEARRALGVHHVPHIADVPAPIFNAVIGVGVALAAVLGRPQVVGVTAGILLDAALAAVAGLALVYHDRMVCPPDARPGVEAAVLPASALLGLSVALAGVSNLALGALAVVVAAVVIAGAPHLNALRRVGREGPGLRLAREAAGIATLLPVLLAGAAPGVPGWARGVLVATGTALAGFDALRTDRVPVRRTLAAVAVLAAVCGVATLLAAAVSVQAAGAAALLVLWYGLRGLLAQVAAGRLERGLALEYGAFVAGAALVLGAAANR